MCSTPPPNCSCGRAVATRSRACKQFDDFTPYSLTQLFTLAAQSRCEDVDVRTRPVLDDIGAWLT